ncbi:MAG: hypothetical protein ACI9R8_001584, partial [Candidatus Paceibacteria bacterium]
TEVRSLLRSHDHPSVLMSQPSTIDHRPSTIDHRGRMGSRFRRWISTFNRTRELLAITMWRETRLWRVIILTGIT